MTLKTFGGITVECERPMVNHKVREFVRAFKYANRVIGEIFIKNDDYATFESAYQTLWATAKSIDEELYVSRYDDHIFIINGNLLDWGR